MGTSLTATGVQFPDNRVQVAPAMTGFRNRIINGNMTIAQRGNTFTNIGNTAYSLDRWRHDYQSAGALTITQAVDAPNGIGTAFSLRATVTTADATVNSTDAMLISQTIEGYNTYELYTSDPFTLSFWVRSSKIGVHCVVLKNSSYDRSYVMEYTVNSANTWEKKSITVANGMNLGVIGGTGWGGTSDVGIRVSWTLACGSNYHTATPNTWLTSNFNGTANQVNCLDTVGNIFAITGVQLEKGSVATDFEQRPYGLELLLCQRYYEVIEYIICMVPWSSGTQVIRFRVPFAVEKRSTPVALTLSAKDGGTGSIGFANNGTRSVIMYASGNYQDVISYPYMTISAEF